MARPVTIDIRPGTEPVEPELAVLRLVADGFTLGQVGRKLDMTEGMVKHRLKSLRIRYGAHNSAQLVAQAFRRGHMK